MKTENYTWSKKNHSIFESYALDLQQFWKSGKKFEYGSRMLNVSMEKQREYMMKNNLRMTYEFLPNGDFADKSIGKGWKDDIYSNNVECRTCEMTRRIYKDQKQIYSQKENVNLYMTVTNVQDKTHLAKQAYNCPNCGALSTVEQLEDMCPYCQTRFQMSDLFPKVTNFFTVEGFMNTEKEVKSSVAKVCIPLMIVSMLYFCYHFNVINPQSSSAIINCLSGIFAGGIFGGIVGYIIWGFLTLFRGIVKAGKVMPMLASSSGSQRKFVRTVKKYSPEFSYEFFTDKVVTILRQLLSEEKIEDNPYYVGASVNIDAPSIVEYAFRGAVGLKKCQMDGQNCNAVVDVFMTDYYWKNNRIHKKDDVFRISLTKNLTKKMNYNFSLAAIQCKNCGASFDATRIKKCPYCSTEYVIGDDDWVVTAIRKR